MRTQFVAREKYDSFSDAFTPYMKVVTWPCLADLACKQSLTPMIINFTCCKFIFTCNLLHYLTSRSGK